MKMPPITHNFQNQFRSVGFEFEFFGVSLERVGEAVLACYGGEVSWASKYDLRIRATKYGNFNVELDSKYLKEIPSQSSADELISAIELPEISSEVTIQGKGIIEGVMCRIAPVELKTPPLPLSDISCLVHLLSELRELGAKGTHLKPYRALGLHLNPEVVSTSVTDILPVLKSFLCLYNQLVEKEGVSLSRKISPYIKPFPQDYMKLVINPRYHPPLDIVISDYLDFNPTRNRPLDMLPLFYYLDPELVITKMDPAFVNARPTFHYRLPNCSIDCDSWSYLSSWNNWVAVECLAYNASELDKACRVLLRALEANEREPALYSGVRAV